jgi:hypothetical protein
MHCGSLFGVERLHQIDLDPQRARTQSENRLVDVLAFRAEGTNLRQSKAIDPQAG